ncbi:MAG: aldehyde dehydrogenase family protein, partial [Actinomycetota bacterium]
MATKPSSTRKKNPATFESINPATGEVVGVFPVFTKSEVEDVVARAKDAAERWANLSFRARHVVLRDWASILTRDMKEAAELI